MKSCKRMFKETMRLTDVGSCRLVCVGHDAIEGYRGAYSVLVTAERATADATKGPKMPLNEAIKG